MKKMEKGKNMHVLCFSSLFEHSQFSCLVNNYVLSTYLQYCLAFTWVVWNVFNRDEQGVLSSLGDLYRVEAAAWNPADK